MSKVCYTKFENKNDVFVAYFMEEKNSILEKIIQSQQVSNIEQFNPVEVVNQLLKPLLPREEDVLRRRFGLTGKPEETLEQIGATYSVTRERIRQIEKTGTTKIKGQKMFQQIVRPVELTISQILEQHGRIMAEELLLSKLLEVTGINDANKNNTLFLLSEILQEVFKQKPADKQYHRFWHVQTAPLRVFEQSVAILEDIIKKYGKTIAFDALVKAFRESDLYKTHVSLFTDDVIDSYLAISQHIAKNPFGDYGLAEWGTIKPKRMNDKIYLILKKTGRPMHFTEITKRINEIHFDKRRAHPPTVHNELILNGQYVLVGRGMYALKEWGYKPGVVAEVIEQILLEAEQPLTRNDLVKKVLERRVVKENTIVLALTNKDRFARLQDGKYTVKTKKIPEQKTS